MKAFNKKIIYKLVFTLVSPLSIGSGKNEATDRDVIVDSQGHPFIPATAIAGVLRSALDDSEPNYIASSIFGYIRTSKNDKHPEFEDKIRVYDAKYAEEKDHNLYIASRDCVKLENKVGVKGAKFDMQAVEPGVKFVSYIELDDEAFSGTVENLLARVDNGELRFGSKTTRGYGQTKLSVYKKEINSAEEWLSLGDFFDGSCFTQNDIIKPTAEKIENIMLKISLKCRGGISIREYSTDVGMPDYETMGLTAVRDSDNNKVPVIPGTSWAGALRSRFEEIAGQDKGRELFGYVETNGGKEKATRSKILFGESRLKNGVYKELTRNSIDRFSGATKDSALYTERTYYYGETELNITLPKKTDEKIKFALAACLADLHNGFLAVGGLTSVGRGLFEITAINGNKDIIKYLDGDSVDLTQFIKEVLPE